jgi:hypothetical protein
MLDKGSLHKRLQDLIDCYTTTDPLQEMSHVRSETNTEETALTWLALAVLHGLNSDAKRITLHVSENDEIESVLEYRKGRLPSPRADACGLIIETARDMVHLGEGQTEMPLVVGLGDSSIDLLIKIKNGGVDKKLMIEFSEQK